MRKIKSIVTVFVCVLTLIGLASCSFLKDDDVNNDNTNDTTQDGGNTDTNPDNGNGDTNPDNGNGDTNPDDGDDVPVQTVWEYKMPLPSTEALEEATNPGVIEGAPELMIIGAVLDTYQYMKCH